MRRIPAVLPVALAFALVLSACAMQSYVPRPLAPDRVTADLRSRDVADPGLRAFLEHHKYPVESWPLPQWGLNGLTLMAVYFNPAMDVARANYAVETAGKITAGERPNPGVTSRLEHHSRTNGGDTLYSVGIGLDIPFETAGKREARLARADALSEEARLAIGSAAWTVRARLRDRFIDVFAALEESKLLRQELDVRRQQVAMLERRQAAGEASPSEASLARLQLRQVRLALDTAEGDIATSRAALAEALGIPYAAVKTLPLDFDRLTSVKPKPLPGQAVQQAAEQNRLDVQEALARYDAAEANLREQIAKQYPNIVLSPDLLWDQGDWITTIAGGILAPIFNRNEGPIAEAEARRKLEAAKFKALLAQVMGQVNQSRLHYRATVNAWNTATGLVTGQAERLRQIEKLITYGETDKLSLVEGQIELVAAKRAQLQARLDALRALGAVEDSVQYPLFGATPLADFIPARAASNSNNGMVSASAGAQ